MHALVYTGTEKIEYREEKDPIVKPGETLIKVQASGICGSDMHAYHGKDERRTPPLILGCLLYTSPSPRDATLSRMPSSA